MPFTLVGWHESVDASTALTKIAALADPHIRVEGDNIIVPSLNQLCFTYAVGTGLIRAQLDSPSLRRLLLYDINPVDPNAEPAYTVAVQTPHRFNSPYPLDVNEPLSCAVLNTGTQWTTVLVWLSDGALTPVTGDFLTVRATGSTTLSPYEWTNVAITFDQTLPAGRYAVVGFRYQSTNAIAGRLVFPGYAWRPGLIGIDTDYESPITIFRNGGLGIWGEFEHNTPPTVDCLARGADTSEIFHFDLLKVA